MVKLQTIKSTGASGIRMELSMTLWCCCIVSLVDEIGRGGGGRSSREKELGTRSLMVAKQ
jgi:hypothetical protein